MAGPKGPHLFQIHEAGAGIQIDRENISGPIQPVTELDRLIAENTRTTLSHDH